MGSEATNAVGANLARKRERYMYIFIYIYAVGSITWPPFGQSRVNNLATFGSITWPPFFEPIKIGVLGDFFVHSFRGVVQN